MTRTVADACAAHAGRVAAPIPRDYLGLPPQDIAWQRLARGPAGLRIGLWVEPAASELAGGAEEVLAGGTGSGATASRPRGAHRRAAEGDWTTRRDEQLGLVHLLPVALQVELGRHATRAGKEGGGTEISTQRQGSRPRSQRKTPSARLRGCRAMRRAAAAAAPRGVDVGSRRPRRCCRCAAE